MKPVDIELRPGVKPYHSNPYLVTQEQEDVFRKEVERLCQLGLLENVNWSEWGYPNLFNQKGIDW